MPHERGDVEAEATRSQPQYLRRMLRARSEVSLLAHRSGPAAADAERAVRMELDALDPGAVSSSVGLAYLSLGEALRAQGKREEALGALLSAARHLRPTVGERHRSARRAAGLVASLTSSPSR